MRRARKLILANDQCPGDVVMLSGAVRDLHRHHPGEFLTDVRTPYPDLWEHHPHITPLDDKDPDVERLELSYPLVTRSNRFPGHFLHGFCESLNSALGTRVAPTECRGEIVLSDGERKRPSHVEEISGRNLPYWIVVAGGKRDYTVKWWTPACYQEVVDHFAGRVLFVQVGLAEDVHPRLSGVFDFVGQTSLRDLVRLVHHAAGVLCPVTAAMHLAAAVPTRPDRHPLRPCVVVAGGREPPQWEAYPGHQFLHTVGMLACCGEGGCWKSRTVPLGDGSEHDRPNRLCERSVEGRLPRCMEMITAGDVIRRIEGYFEGGAARALEPDEYATARPFLAAGREAPDDHRRSAEI